MTRFSTLAAGLVLTGLLTAGVGDAQAQFGRGQAHGHTHSYSYRQLPRFGGRSHLDALSADMQARATAICWEMYNNYQRNRGWRETYAEAYKMLQDAKHIRQLVHDAEHHGARNELQHIAADLAEVDELFHHIEEDIARWRPSRAAPHHHGDPHHHDVHPDLNSLMEEFEETLHHLMADYGVKGQSPPPAPGGPGGDSPPPPPVGFRP